MTDEQIKQRIAEACGWKCAGHPDQLKATSGWEFGYQFVLRPDGELVTHYSIPNYCTDLNAMHDVERVLIAGFEDDPESSELWSNYQTNLIIACPAYLSYHATARQRAEAFLRTLGKWEEVAK